MLFKLKILDKISKDLNCDIFLNVNNYHFVFNINDSLNSHLQKPRKSRCFLSIDFMVNLFYQIQIESPRTYVIIFSFSVENWFIFFMIYNFFCFKRLEEIEIKCELELLKHAESQQVTKKTKSTFFWTGWVFLKKNIFFAMNPNILPLKVGKNLYRMLYNKSEWKINITKLNINLLRHI